MSFLAAALGEENVGRHLFWVPFSFTLVLTLVPAALCYLVQALGLLLAAAPYSAPLWAGHGTSRKSLEPGRYTPGWDGAGGVNPTSHTNSAFIDRPVSLGK